jgi:hypothetical protein
MGQRPAGDRMNFRRDPLYPEGHCAATAQFTLKVEGKKAWKTLSARKPTTESTRSLGTDGGKGDRHSSPKVYLTAGSISVAIDRLLDRGLVSRVESPEDRRVRIVSLPPKGKELIAPIFRKHAAEIRKVFADASPKELRALETKLKKIGKRAESLGTGVNPKCLSQR